MKKPDTKACTHYLAGDGAEMSFVPKAYLGKELLPEIIEIEK